MIAVQHLSMRLTAAGRPVTILDDVTLEIPSKQTVAVMSPAYYEMSRHSILKMRNSDLF